MRKAISMSLSGYGDTSTVILPLAENLDGANIYIDDEIDEAEATLAAFEELKEHWMKQEWGYHKGALSDMELIDVYTTAEVEAIKSQGVLFETPEIEYEIVDNPDDTTEDGEFYKVFGFTERMIDGELYSRPFDTCTDGSMYICYFSLDCMKGQEYSKDYAYFECDECNRCICEQNPSNGWMTQYKYHPESDDSRICNKCFQELMFSEGINVEEALRTKQINGSFFSDAEIRDNGFEIVDGLESVLVGAGYSGSQSEEVFFRLLTERLPVVKDKVVLFSIESMAIGGMGGYVTVWARDKQAA